MLRINYSFLYSLFLKLDRQAAAILFYVALPLLSAAQVIPSEGSTVNYRIVGFSVPAKPATTEYTLEIAKGKFTNENDFASNVYKSFSSSQSRIVGEVPSFDALYTWRIVYKNKSAAITRSVLYHFSTGSLPGYGENGRRMRIKSNTGANNDAYVLVDGASIIYDLNGEPIWYLPAVADPLSANTDMRVSPTGSITFLSGGDAYDVSYSGKVLWRSKDHLNLRGQNEMNFTFHHEFCKLSNGHYMALIGGKQIVDNNAPDTRSGQRFFQPVHNSSLAEFDQQGKVMWMWESASYLQQSDLWNWRTQHPDEVLDPHENSFYFDEKNGVIYLSMSGVSRILKIQYPSGRVLGAYGNKILPSDQPQAPVQPQPIGLPAERQPITPDVFWNKKFFHQHALKHENGLLYVFNNNLVRGRENDTLTGNNPKIVKFRESGDSLEVVWEYDCSRAVGAKNLKPGGGGNIMPLPGNSVFVSMSTPYGDLFIVDANKNISWSAVTEALQIEDNTWVQKPRYRASYISRAQLEQMIWSR